MKSLAVLVLVSVGGSISGVLAGTALPVVESLRCADEVQELLDEWAITGEILRAPGGFGGRKTFRLATRELGRWVTLERDESRREAALVHTSPSGGQRVELDESCRTVSSPVDVVAADPTGMGFTDRDLTFELEKNERLVVFLWSPHMPLSVEALFEIEAATRALGLPLVALIDPSSDPSYVEAVAREWGIPAASRRPLASIELLFRDLAIHTPALLVFEHGRAKASPLPGYRDRMAYRRYLGSLFSDEISPRSQQRR